MRWAVGWLSGFALLLAALLAPAAAQERIDMALVLSVDTSTSVDNGEFRLQMAGLATAFRHPSVQYAILTGAPRGLAVTLVQWSGAGAQAQVIPWTLIREKADADRLANRISATGRQVVGGRTALGEAMAHGVALLAELEHAALRHVIDISGDGGSNEGRLPTEARELARSAGVQINAVAILNEEPRLDHYFSSDVIVGPGAFLVTATDYVDFARAIRLKLVREILGTPIAFEDSGRRHYE
ncbi:MAG: hypothetical protein TEF_05860 [Rhizobiales bacterium NRL2]|jgi:hypothetical protein|nr:MAG: hypothetical protein TEF_05860 [Rhizobiales bacterium NRL2]